MKHFEASGLWSTGDEPSRQVAGTLRYTKDGLILDLIGTFSEGWTAGGSDSYDRILGVVGDCPHGARVTLIDAFTTRKRLSFAGGSAEKIYANFSLIGASHVDDDSTPFESIDLTFSYLNDWLAFGRVETNRPVGTEAAFDFSIQYRRPEPIVIRSEQESITVYSAFVSQCHVFSASINASCHILVEPTEALDRVSLVTRYLKPLNDLVTFATDTPNASDDVKISAARPDPADRKEQYSLVFKPVFNLETKLDLLHSSDMLFTYEESKEAGLEIFQKWLDFHRGHEQFCAVYFGLQYAAPTHVEERISRLFTALALLCTPSGASSKRVKTLSSGINAAVDDLPDEDERELIRLSLPSAHELEAPSSLYRLLNEYSDLMDPLIEGDRRGFVIRFLSDLQLAQRRQVGPPRDIVDGQLMLNAMGVVETVIKILVLRALGFDEQRVAALIRRSAKYQRLRVMTSLL